MLVDFLPVLLLGFGLGCLHALDADHVMTLLAINNQEARLRRVIYYATYWAIGHGGVLLLCGILLFGFGVILPEKLLWLAELSVGVLLVFIGVTCLWQLRNTKLKVHSHGDVQHIHWHTESHTESNSKPLIENHKPVMVGVLHGLAGSAPVMALIPALNPELNQGSLVVALIYLLLFSTGMMLSMTLFGLGFARFQRHLQSNFNSAFHISRYILAFLSAGFGAFWILKASL